MPNRVVREDILHSDRVDKLTYPAEVFYRRLMSMLDDFGLGDGRLSVIRSTLYPLRLDRVSEADLGKWIAECEKAGLVSRYTVDEKPYVVLHNFRQSPRQKRQKYPPPPNLQADASTCKQMQADARLNETKRNEVETKALTRFDPSDYYKTAKDAFDEIQKDELFLERLLRILHSNGILSANMMTVMLGVKKFLTIEGAKDSFYLKPKTEIKNHLVNWMNKNAKTIE
jgi:hypothetical protein